MFLPFSTFELINPRPQRTANGPHCAETSLQVVSDRQTLATKQKTFDPYRLGRVAENTKKVAEIFINDTELLQIFRQTLSFPLVSVLSVQYGPGLVHHRHLQILMAIFLPHMHQSLRCNIHDADRYFQSHTKYFPRSSLPIYLYGMQR